MAKQRKPVRARAATETAKRVGRKPSHSIVLLYVELGGPVCGILLGPTTTGPSPILSGHGMHEVIGKWRDLGYLLGRMKDNPPAWALTFVPQHSRILSYAVVTGVSQGKTTNG